MKRIMAAVLVLSVFLTGCTVSNNQCSSVSAESTTVNTTDISTSEKTFESSSNETTTVSTTGSSSDETQSGNTDSSDYIDEQAKNMNFRSLGDPELLKFMEGSVYAHLVDQMGKDVCIDNVSAIYLSQEFIDELTYNSKANVFFGYTLKELDEQFKGQSYLFTVENGQTVVKPRSPYDDTYDKMIRNVAIGTGVILICVTISVVTYGAGAPAASAIFACAAKSGTIMGLSSGTISGVATGVTTGVRTGDWEKAKKEGALAASESFKFSVIAGTIMGGAGEAVGLHNVAKATKLSMDQVAIIQRETKLPLQFIKHFDDFKQYEIIRGQKLKGVIINGKQAIVREIDLNPTNLERMRQGLAPLDPSGKAYELHHLKQDPSGILAILTQEEHRGAGNMSIWHKIVDGSEVDHGSEWIKTTKAFWKAYYKMVAK